jgi:hypothetical protein
MRRSNIVVFGAATLLAGSVLAGAAASASVPRTVAHHPEGTAAQARKVHFFPAPSGRSHAQPAADERQGSPPLLFNGGPIMKTEKSYAIFWNPATLQSGATSQGLTTKYKSLIKRYFSDVGGSTFYHNNIQYTSNGNVPTTTKYTATWVDTTAFPPGHCTTSDTGTNCVTDADIQARVVADAAAHGITKSPSDMFFVYTPKNEGSCFDSTCAQQSYQYYCAYHSYIPNAGGNLIYANMPYPTVSSGNNCYFPPGGSQQFPNNLNADAVINVTSHEQTEAVTDPQLNAWYDAAGYEIGDECAWDFGPTLSNSGDVTLNGHPYGLQKEASNASANCVLSGP